MTTVSNFWPLISNFGFFSQNFNLKVIYLTFYLKFWLVSQKFDFVTSFDQFPSVNSKPKLPFKRTILTLSPLRFVTFKFWLISECLLFSTVTPLFQNFTFCLDFCLLVSKFLLFISKCRLLIIKFCLVTSNVWLKLGQNKSQPRKGFIILTCRNGLPYTSAFIYHLLFFQPLIASLRFSGAGNFQNYFCSTFL